jgi:tRNA 2-thiouridine synthesizing protein A
LCKVPSLDPDAIAWFHSDMEGREPKTHWDAGDMGCGQLVFELRRRMDRLEPGDTLEIVALDPGAPIDIPAWCRMTGHTLVSAEHPTYIIRRRADAPGS